MTTAIERLFYLAAQSQFQLSYNTMIIRYDRELASGGGVGSLNNFELLFLNCFLSESESGIE
jgi:hypothetical protein